MRVAAFPVLLALAIGCNGDCTSNAVVVAEEVKALAPIVASVELYENADLDPLIFPEDQRLVVNPNPHVPKLLRINFLLPVERDKLTVPLEPCQAEPCPVGFLEFGGIFDPADNPTPTAWVQGWGFDRIPTDGDGPPTMSVTYHLADDLIHRPIDAVIGVPVTMHLENIDPGYEPAQFYFVLAKRSLDDLTPPRIVSVTPGPLFARPGWNIPLERHHFVAGEQLADVLARLDSFVFANDSAVGLRPRPHGEVKFVFDDPMVNMVVQVTPSPDDPTNPDDPRGFELIAPTVGFLTPFTEARSDTSAGLAPDQIYRVEVLSALSRTRSALLPVAVGTQNENGQFLIPNFSTALYNELIAEGYTPMQLAGQTAYSFRTGPFRITHPQHRGPTNAATAPAGRYTAYLQFAEPAEGIDPPTRIDVTLSPAGRQSTAMTIPFPAGTSDTIRQDGFVRTAGVTRHAVPLQLPDRDYDDVVELEMVVSGNQFINSDKIQFHHDTIVPNLALEGTVTNLYESDGYVEQMCFIADCDVTSFILQASNNPTPILLNARDAERTSCAFGLRTYCFSNVPLGTTGSESDVKISVTAVDDQGNKSAPIVINARPRCQVFDKFVGAGGKLAAITTTDDGNPTVAWSIGSELVYAAANVDGSWPGVANHIVSHEPDQTFGLGFDFLLHPVDNEPVVCVVTAPQGPPTQMLGQLRVLKRTRVSPQPEGSARIRPPDTVEQFAWREIARENDVRPLGCSLTSLGNTVVVGWSGIDAARLGFVLGNVLATQNLPLPPGLVRANNVIWDVDVAAVGAARVYFTYRTANPTWGHVIAPGSIVAGYIDGTFRVAQDLSNSQAPLPSLMRTGFGPRIIADEHGVGVAYISAIETDTFDFESTRALDVLGAPHPALGMPIQFGPRYTNADPPPFGRLAADGLTRPSDGIAVPFGPPALIRGVGAEARLIAGWSRAGSFATEEIAIASVDPQTAAATVAVLDRRVTTPIASTGARTERIAVNLAQGKHGYFAVFRNPLVSSGGALVFANEQDHPVTLPTGSFACAQAWHTAFIYADELKLKYQRAGVANDFFDPTCVGLPDFSPVTRPFSAGIEGQVFPEEMGARETLLDDVVAGIFIENGRGLLKDQTNVCVPDSGMDACAAPPTTPPNAGPTCVSTQTRPDRLQPAPPSETFRDEANGRRGCQDGQLMLSFDDIGAIYTCYRCPSGHVYDPSVRRCVACSSGTVQYLPSGTVGQIPSTNDVGIIRELNLSVRCVSCDSSDCEAANPTSGIMDWIPTAKGELCTRCTGGSQLIECAHDLQCNIFPNARCAAVGWPSAGRRVCVQKCSTHDDCRGGFCVGGDEGYCADVNTQNEVPSGFNLLCRPIGCDECFQNSYCTVNSGCPQNHTCSTGEPIKSPACIARTFLSRQFEDQITLALKARGRPEEIARAEEVADTLQLLRAAVLRSLRKTRLPYRFEKKIPLTTIQLTKLHPVVIRDIDLYFSNGAIVLSIETSKIQVDGNVGFKDFSASTPGAVKIGFFFGLHTGISGRTSPPAENDSMSFSGLGLSLVGLASEGLEWDVAGDVSIDLSFFLDDVGRYLGPLVGDYASRSFRVIGGLREGNTAGIDDQPDLLRCVFARPDLANPPFTHRVPTQCQGGEVPPIYNAAINDLAMEIHYPRCGGTP